MIARTTMLRYKDTEKSIEEIADEYAGKAKIVKINVDEAQKTAGSMGIQSIPTIALYKDGKVAETVIGVRSKGDYAAMIDNAL